MRKPADATTMSHAESLALHRATDSALGIIEFDLNGTVLTVDPVFLDMFGVEREEIVGKHHRLLCEPSDTASTEYLDLWQSLRAGRTHEGTYRRQNKAGETIWIRASYHPTLDESGTPVKIVEITADITAAISRNAEHEGMLAAISRSQAVVEFDLDGTIVSANPNFLKLMGYELEEIVGKHHRLFCEPAYAASPEYSEFWRRLGGGEYEAADFKRLGKGGRELWLQATYTPILDANGRPHKIVKLATDITATKLRNAEINGMLTAVNRAHAVADFDLDGTLLSANPNFLRLYGYKLEEVIGKHHSTFCTATFVDSPEYSEFWAMLGRGEFHSGEIRRVRGDGAELWLQATYNPILDVNGRPRKVVKFASDITDEVQRRDRAFMELATPVSKIWDGVLFLPLVGIVDSKRSADVMKKALSCIADTQASTLMLDISGVALIDTAVANHLLKVAKAASLMGCRTVLSGISPAIAQTIAGLGIDLSLIETSTTIAAALQKTLGGSLSQVDPAGSRAGEGGAPGSGGRRRRST